MAYKLGSNSNSGAYSGMQNSGLISSDKSIFGKPKEDKKKVKVNKRGEIKTTETKFLPNGKKIKSKSIQGPTTYTVSEAASVSVNMSGGGSGKLEYFAPKAEIDPGNSTEGNNKPMVKPLKSRRQAYDNRGEQYKDLTFPEYGKLITKWNEENPPEKSKGDLKLIPSRGAVRMQGNSGGELKISGVKTITPSTYSSYEQKVKGPNDKNPPSKPPTGGTSTGDGLCTAANPDSCNAFSEKDGGEGKMINKMFARGDKKKQAERNAAGDARKRKNAAEKSIASSSRTFKKEGRKELKADQKAFAKEMGAETKGEKKELKAREKGQRVEFKKQTNDRFKTAENRKNKNARLRFSQANKTLKSNATVGDKLRKGGAKLATNLLGKGKQEQRATTGRSTTAKNNRDILKSKDLAAMTSKKPKKSIIKASF